MKYVITGSSSGLGYSLARKLLKQGDVIGLSRRNRDFVFDEHIDYHFTHINADLSLTDTFSENSNVINCLKEILQDSEFTLVLNAGVFYSGTRRLEEAERTKLFWVNLFSIIELIQQMQKLKLKRIFFINSISGLIGQKTQHEYASSKHGLMGYLRSLINEAKEKPYDVMAINPGGINTELWSEYPEIDNTSFLSPEELAGIIVNLISLKGRIFIPSFTILPAADL